MRTAIIMLLAAMAALQPAHSHAQGEKLKVWTDSTTIRSVMADTGPLTVDAYRVFTVANYKGVVSWETDPVYEIGYDAAGKPILVSGEVDYLEIAEPAKIPQRDGLKLIDVGQGSVIVWGKTPGKVRLVARGVVDGVARRLDTQVIEVTGLRSQPVIPPIADPGTPPIVIPPKPQSYYFLLVRPDGPVQADVLDSLKLSAWDDVKKAGHKFKDLPLNEVPTKSGKSPIPNGTTLPCVLTLRIEGDTSYVVPPPSALPKSDADVKRLMEVKP